MAMSSTDSLSLEGYWECPRVLYGFTLETLRIGVVSMRILVSTVSLAASVSLVVASPSATAVVELQEPVAGVAADVAQRKAPGLTVKGKLTAAGSVTSIILIGNDGSSMSARIKKSGAFVLRAREAKIAKRVNPARGRGATLHLLSNGRYAGPVLLKKSGKKGFARFSAGLPSQVNLRTIKVSAKGFALAAKSPKGALIDTTRYAKLRNGVPTGAGTQGATGRLRSTVSATALAVNNLSPSQSALGADIDKDGVPNVADVDLNGDQIFDAAQADSAIPTADGPLRGDAVLEGRQWGLVDFKKILDMDRTTSVNSNRNPAVTWDQLATYLANQLKIEAAAPVGTLQKLLCGDPEQSCEAAKAVTTLTMGCSWLAYCQPGSPALTLGPPDSPLDRQPLTNLLDGNGQIVMPREPETGSIIDADVRLMFLPKTTNPDNLQFTGDSFEFTALDANGNALAREAEVLASSLVTAAEWQAIDGIAIPVDTDLTQPLPIPTNKTVEVSFFRPQRLADGPRGELPQLLDRGGLQYSVTIWNSAANANYYCRDSQVNAVTPDLVDLVPKGEYEGEPLLYDSNLNPANGAAQAFTLDIPGCLTNPETGPSTTPPVGATVTVEITAEDADGNRAMSSFSTTMQ